MAQVTSGRNVILFFRALKDAQTEDAAKLRFQTEHTITKEKETEATITKDGSINSISDGENSADITSLAYNDDVGTITTWEQLEEYFDENEYMEMWQVDITNAAENNGAVKPTYFRGYFTSFEISAPADGNVELSYTFTIDGTGIKGEDTLSASQLEAVNATVYEYQSIQAGNGTTAA